MAVNLNIQIKTTSQFILVGTEWVGIDTTVTAKGKVVSGATVTFSILSGGTGTFNTISGTTDANGIFSTKFQANAVGYYNLQAVASKTGFVNDSLTVLILSYASPTQYTTKGTLFLAFIEQRKIDLLKTLAEFLDNDPDFYLSTGASNTITYLTEWNYQVKNFPLIVCSSESPTHSQIGINPIIDNDTTGNWVEITYSLNLVCTNKNILDRLTEKVIFILGTYKYYELYAKYGIAIMPNGISTGGTVTEAYGASFLYANKVSLKARVEIAYNVSADTVIDDVIPAGTIVDEL